jgi:manganese/zinc/iron transport system permease protein
MTPQWDWMIDGWIVAVGALAAIACALVGNYLVLRRMSLMGDAISHAVLPGLAVAFVLTGSRDAWPMFVGAALVGVLTALLSQAISRYGKVEHGAAMGVVFSVLFALGLVLIRQAADHVDLDPGCVLYGNLAQIPLDALDGTTPRAAVNLGVVCALNVVFVALFYKELKICAFDPALATTLGINASLMHYLLMIMVALTAVAAFEAVGSILVIAMLIVPPATAHLLTDRLGVMLALSVILASLSAVVGHVMAFLGPGWVGLDPMLSVNTAGMMAVVTGGLFIIALLFAPQYGLVAKVGRRMAVSGQIVREDILGLIYRWQEGHGGAGAPVPQEAIVAAMGGGMPVRLGLRSLARQKAIRIARDERGVPGLLLSEQGQARAAKLVRSHRLWESYVDKHFDLPADHLHAPAGRVEHFISEKMMEEIATEVENREKDPHGRPIPRTERTG